MKYLNSSRFFILFVVLLGGLSSCKNFEEVKISSINNVKVKEISAKGIEAEVTVTIDNPNPLAFNVYRSSADIKYGSMDLGTARLAKKVRIPARSNQQHTFILKGDFKSIALNDIMSLIDGKNKKLELNGYLVAGRLFYRKKFAVNQKEVLNLIR